MKVQVKDEQGRAVNPFPHYIGDENFKTVSPKWAEFETKVKTYPAPDIADGTHECEMKWQFQPESRPDEWEDERSIEDHNISVIIGIPTRQKWVLVEQEKEGVKSLSKMEEETKWQLCPKCNGVGQITNPYMDITSPLTIVCDICDGAKLLATPNSKSTRIAELEARVAELEGVLNTAKQELEEFIPFTHVKVLDCIYEALATNALKNQQP